MTEESLYAELGVPEGASFDEIKAVYQSLSPSWEAAGKGDEEQRSAFRRLGCAYAVLSDADLRRHYDENPNGIDFAKFELAIDLALKGYDDEMLEEYLSRLSIPQPVVKTMVDSISRIREALSEKREEPVYGGTEGFRKVAAGQGWQWVVEGFSIFRKSPLLWVVLCMILTGIGLTLSLIPIAGEIILYLASPIFAAGLMQGCRDIEEGEELELAHLFLGFRKDTKQLASIGMVYLLGQILILGIMVAFGGDTMSKLFFGSNDVDPSNIPAAEMSRVMLGLFAGMAVSVPLMMMIWFAPVLVIFRGMQARQAMQLSFSACLANMRPFLVFGSVLLAMAFLSGITFGLGLLLMVPLIFTSTYASYADIFEGRPHIDIKAG